MESENKKLEKLMEKQLFAARITMICSVLLLACMIVITVAVVNLVPKIDATLTQINTIAQEAEAMMKDLETLSKDLDTLTKATTDAVTEFNKVIPSLSEAGENIAAISKSLTDEGLPKLYETLENLEGLKKLQDIDISSLNGAIQSLYDVVQPLSNLFGKF